MSGAENLVSLSTLSAFPFPISRCDASGDPSKVASREGDRFFFLKRSIETRV